MEAEQGLRLFYRMKYLIFIITCILGCVAGLSAQNLLTLRGEVLDAGLQKGVAQVAVQIMNSNYTVLTDTKGHFTLTVPFRKHLSVLFLHTTYEKRVKEIDLDAGKDSLYIVVALKQKENELTTVDVYAKPRPDTLVSSPKFSIYDYDFYEDGYILLTAEHSLEKAELKLAGSDGRIMYTTALPKDAGTAKELYHDYMGYTNVICENSIYRINVFNNAFVLFSLNVEDYNAFVKPIVDTVHGKVIFSDYWKEYPLFNYYSYDLQDSTHKHLITITNKELMDAYNFEYYSMKPREMLEARRLAMDLHTDKRIVAALMTGFTKSMFYEPLFAPLFIVKDTMCVFDHYKDMLFHFDHEGHKIDSIAISYNHPKNWHDWKRVMVKDDIENEIYAVYNRSGHKYLRQIDHRTGKDNGLYTLQFHSADKIKVHNGYAYYIYRPFESLQEKFLYREEIRLEQK